MLNITEAATEKIRAILAAQNPPATAIRVTSRTRGKYSMGLEAEGKPKLDDTVLPFEGFSVFVDPQSLPSVEGAGLDFIEGPNGSGFQFSAPTVSRKAPEPKPIPEGSEGDLWRQIQEILDEEINPAVAGHGGHIRLMEYDRGVVIVEMSGGCQGCGMASMTLKQGVERVLRGHLPEIREVLDVTDHAGGRNPYYAPSAK
jgi:Fe/S biogenesis protein NfuA